MVKHDNGGFSYFRQKVSSLSPETHMLGTRTCAYQRVTNASFSESFANVLNGWSLGCFSVFYYYCSLVSGHLIICRLCLNNISGNFSETKRWFGIFKLFFFNCLLVILLYLHFITIVNQEVTSWQTSAKDNNKPYDAKNGNFEHDYPETTQLTVTCSKSTIETLIKGVKYVQS